jgi:catechol 2,3-dioxygenase-like lactoylglutathione lyase family enzyme
MIQPLSTFCSYSVSNIETAREFYSRVLGLRAKENDMGILDFEMPDNQKLILYPKDNHTPASFTVLNFVVANINKAVDHLIEKGVVMERYEDFDHDDKGIAQNNDGPNMAWFKDPSGNIISVMEAWE